MSNFGQHKPCCTSKRKWDLSRRKTSRKSLSIRGPIYDEIKALADAQGRSVASVIEEVAVRFMRADKPQPER